MPDPEWTAVHPLTDKWKLKQIRDLITSMPDPEWTTVHPLTDQVETETDQRPHHFYAWSRMDNSPPTDWSGGNWNRSETSSLLCLIQNGQQSTHWLIRWKLKQIRDLITSMPDPEWTTVHPLTDQVETETDQRPHHFYAWFRKDNSPPTDWSGGNWNRSETSSLLCLIQNGQQSTHWLIRWKLKQIRDLITSMPHLELTTVHPLTIQVKTKTDLGSHHFSNLFTTDRKKFITWPIRCHWKKRRKTKRFSKLMQLVAKIEPWVLVTSGSFNIQHPSLSRSTVQTMPTSCLATSHLPGLSPTMTGNRVSQPA